MREIKFRAWYKDWSPKENSDGWLIPGTNKLQKNGMQFVDSLWWSNRKKLHIKLGDWGSSMLATDEIAIMQYTGLKDKNGKEIYEGDIITSNLIKDGEVKYIFAEYVIATGSFVERITDLVRHKWKLEVIGNIYENPELLNQ